MTSSHERPAGPGRVCPSAWPPPAERAVIGVHSLSGREESTREGRRPASGGHTPATRSCRHPPDCFKGADPSRGLFRIRRWMATKSHKRCATGPDKGAARGEPFPIPGAFHHASARPSGSTVNRRSHPVTAQGGDFCTLCCLQLGHTGKISPLDLQGELCFPRDPPHPHPRGMAHGHSPITEKGFMEKYLPKSKPETPRADCLPPVCQQGTEYRSR